MTVTQPAQTPTPKFYRTVKTGGLIMATIGGALLANPTGLPPGLLKIAGYLALAGGIASAISQLGSTGNDQTAKVAANGQ